MLILHNIPRKIKLIKFQIKVWIATQKCIFIFTLFRLNLYPPPLLRWPPGLSPPPLLLNMQYMQCILNHHHMFTPTQPSTPFFFKLHSNLKHFSFLKLYFLFFILYFPRYKYTFFFFICIFPSMFFLCNYTIFLFFQFVSFRLIIISSCF